MPQGVSTLGAGGPRWSACTDALGATVHTHALQAPGAAGASPRGALQWWLPRTGGGRQCGDALMRVRVCGVPQVRVGLRRMPNLPTAYASGGA